MKAFIYLASILFLFSACTKDTSEPKVTDGKDNENPPQSSLITVKHTDEWQIDLGLKINENLNSHYRIVKQVMNVNGQEYHYQIYNTRYQVQGYVSTFNNGAWGTLGNVGYNATIVNNNSLIASVAITWDKKIAAYSIETYMLDVAGKSWINYSQSLKENPATSYQVINEGENLFLVSQFNLKDPIDIWKWENSTKKWELVAKQLNEAKKWWAFSLYNGLPGEFVFRAYEEGADKSASFYVYKNGALKLLYKTPQYEQNSVSAVINVVPFQGKYLLIDGRVGFITGLNSIEPLHKDVKGGNLLSQVVDGKIFLLSGNRDLGTYGVSGLEVYDTKTNKLHQLSLEVNSKNIHYRLRGPQVLTGWNFKVDGNKIELIANTNHGVSGGSIMASAQLITYNVEW